MKKAMKSLAVIFVAAATLVLSGCTKDAEDLIIGTWKAVSNTTTISGHPDASMNTSHTETFPANVTLQLTFNKDKTGTVYESFGNHSESSDFTYSVADDILYITTEDGDLEGLASKLTIESVDKKELTISNTYKTWDEYDGEEFEYNEKMTIVLNKIK